MVWFGSVLNPCLPSLTCPDRGSASFGGAAAVVVVKLFISFPSSLPLSRSNWLRLSLSVDQNAIEYLYLGSKTGV